MSIVIERQPGGDMLGECEYHIIHNGVFLTSFLHNRPDDLKACLFKAAESVSKGRWEHSLELYKKGGGG